MISSQKAKKYYQKLTYGSTYERFFGRVHEINSGEVEILKFKKFSELKMATYLNAQAKYCIDNWVSLKESDYYVGLVIFVVRNLYTFLKNAKARVTEYSDSL